MYCIASHFILPDVVLFLLIQTQFKEGFFLFVCFRERLNSGGSGGGGGGGESKADSGELSLYSPLKVVIFVALMCGMLVLMYFFYKVLG